MLKAGGRKAVDITPGVGQREIARAQPCGSKKAPLKSGAFSLGEKYPAIWQFVLLRMAICLAF